MRSPTRPRRLLLTSRRSTEPQKYSTAADPVVYWLPEVLAVSKKLQLLDPGAALSSDPTRHPSLAATMYVGRRREYVVRVKEDAEKIRQFEKDNVARQQQEDDEKRGRRYQQCVLSSTISCLE